MSFLLKTTERKSRSRFLIFFIILFLLFVIFFGTPIQKIFAPALTGITNPLFGTGSFLKEKIVFLFRFLQPKNSLIKENEELRDALLKQNIRVLYYQKLESDYLRLSKLSGLYDEKTYSYASVLRTPDASPYDTILINKGADDGLSITKKVFSETGIPIGKIVAVYKDTAEVKLYSTSGESHAALVGEKEIRGTATGRGGGNFEIFFPHGTEAQIGDRVVFEEVSEKPMGVVEDVSETEGGTFIRILFKLPISFSDISFVAIEK